MPCHYLSLGRSYIIYFVHGRFKNNASQQHHKQDIFLQNLSRIHEFNFGNEALFGGFPLALFSRFQGQRADIIVRSVTINVTYNDNPSKQIYRFKIRGILTFIFCEGCFLFQAQTRTFFTIPYQFVFKNILFTSHNTSEYLEL